MNLLILDNEFNEIGLIDNFESMIWTDRYNDYGDFEIVISPNTLYKSYLIEGNYAYLKQSEHLMIFETVNTKMDTLDGDKMTASGRSLESILDRRVLVSKLNISSGTTLNDAIKNIINDNIINPPNADRKINNFIYVDSEDPKILNEELEELEFRIGDNIYDIISSLCKIYEIGFKVILNEKTFEFHLYKGKDRSYNNEDNNEVVIFSPKLDNLRKVEHFSSAKDYRNTGFVLGERDIYTTLKDPHPSSNETWRVLKDVSEDTVGEVLTVQYKNVKNNSNTYLRNIISPYIDNYPININKNIYKNYNNVSSLKVTGMNGELIANKKPSENKIKLANIDYWYSDYNITSNRIELTLLTTFADGVLAHSVANCKHYGGKLVIDGKSYNGYNELESFTVNGKLNTVISFSKPTLDKNKYSKIKISDAEYCVDKSSVSLSNNSLSFNITDFAGKNHDTLYNKITSANGYFIIDDVAYENFKKLTSFNYNSGSISISLSKEEPSGTTYSVVINSVTYTASSWSVSNGSISITFKNPSGNIETLLSNIIRGVNSTNTIKINNTNYTGYVDVNNWSISWSNNERSLQMQFRKPDESPVVTINGKKYEYETYSGTNEDDSISIQFKNIKTISTLINDCKSHSGSISIDGNTFTGFTEVDSYTVTYVYKESEPYTGNSPIAMSMVEVGFYKPLAKIININNVNYKSKDYSITNDTISITIYEVPESNIEALLENAKAHAGRDIIIDGQTYSGYSDFGSIEINPYTVFDEQRVNSGNYLGKTIYKATISFSKPSEETDYDNKQIYVYQNGEEIEGLLRKEIFVNSTDYTSETENGEILSDEDYISGLKNKGLNELINYTRTSAIDAEFEFNSQFEYNKDFYMGDYVDVEDKFTSAGLVQIIEYIYSQDSSGTKEYPTFNIVKTYK